MLPSEMTSSQESKRSSHAILELLQGAWIARSIHVAASLGLADLLKDGPKTTSTLAQATGTHEPSLSRLLRSLASVGVFTEVEPGSFAQTPLSDALRTDRPDSIYPMTRMLGEEWQTRIWENLDYSIRTGQPAFPHVYETSMPEFILQHPAEGKRINLGLTSFSAMVNAPIAQAYDFSACETLVDLGGGLGSLLTTILTVYPTLQGILFERPSVIEAARGYLDPGLNDRCQLVAGNFFEAVPAGADAYLLKQVIHDWSDEDSTRILRNCRKVIKPGGKVLIADRVIQTGDRRETSFNKFWDLLMLVIEAARGYLDPGLNDRCQLVAGNFFEAVPAGADAYLLKQVIHDWSDEDSIRILRTCRNVIKPGGKVLIADRVIQAGEGPETSFNKYWDLLMLVIAEGRERTEAEFSRLYEAAGFRLTRVVDTGTPISVVEGIPV